PTELAVGLGKQEGRMVRLLLHLIEHRGQRCFHPERLLYLVSSDEGILAVFQKTRALMLADEFCEGRSIRLPIRREALKMFEDGVDAGFLKESDRVFGVFDGLGSFVVPI